MVERRHQHEHRYRRLHVDDHDHGGNDINDKLHDLLFYFQHRSGHHHHGCTYHDRTRHNDDAPTRNEHDINNRTDHDVARQYVVSADLIDNLRDYLDHHDVTNERLFYLKSAARAVVDSAARVLGTDGAADKPDDDDDAALWGLLLGFLDYLEPTRNVTDCHAAWRALRAAVATRHGV